MIRNIRKSLTLTKKSLGKIAVFEMLFGLISFMIIFPVSSLILKAAMMLENIDFLTSSNLLKFLSRPFSWISILFIFTMIIVAVWFNLSSAIYIYTNIIKNIKFKTADAFSYGLFSLKLVFKRQDFKMFLYILSILPMVCMQIIVIFFVYIGVPNIFSYYRGNLNLTLIAYISAFSLVIISFIVSSAWIFTPHVFLLKNESFRNAREESHDLTRNRKIKNICGLIIWNILFFSVFFVVILLLSIIPVAVSRELIKSSLALKTSLTIIKYGFQIILLCMAFFSLPFTYSYITATYFTIERRPMEIVKKPTTALKINPNNSKFLIGVVDILFIINFVFSQEIGYPKFNFNLFKTPDISAHRGYSSVAPENSYYSFREAIACGVDFIELDVQETKDGEIIVMHDHNFLRTAGIDKNVWEVTYDEIKDFDIGSLFSPIFFEARIMKLEEVLKMAKGKVKLNIEIKKTNHEKNIEKSVIDLVEKYDMQSDVYITSFSYAVLRKVKFLNPDIHTAYTTNFSYGDPSKLIYADAISINQMFITSRLVTMWHNCGKKVFSWTANKSRDITRLIGLHVDNIITNYPEKAIKITYREYTGRSFMSILYYLVN